MIDTQGQSQVGSLFQKAHGKIVMLQRVDQQIAALVTQRRRIQEEINAAQKQINEEFDRLSEQSGQLPAKLLSEITGSGRIGDISNMDQPAQQRQENGNQPAEPVGNFRDEV